MRRTQQPVMGKITKKKRLSYPQVRSLARDFIGHRISAAGVSYIVTSKTRNRRYLWGILLFMTLGFMGYMTYNVINEYLGYPKTVLKEDKIKTRLEFPAVTMCSLNPMSGQYLEKSSIYKLKKLSIMLNDSAPLEERVQQREECYSNPMCRWSWFAEKCTCVSSPCSTEFCIQDSERECSCSMIMCSVNDTQLESACRTTVEGSGSSKCICWKDFRYPKATTTDDKDQVNRVLAVVSDEEVRDVISLITDSAVDDLMDIQEELVPTTNDIYNFGTEFDRMVISCSYEGRRCDKENFTILYHVKFGKCYMFNYIGGDESKLEETLSIHNYGSASGLQVLLQMEKEHIVDLLTRELGVRVVVHDPREMPFVSEHGVNIRLHDFTAVELTLSEINRLGSPWSNCAMDGSRFPFDYNESPYDQLGCQKKCRYHYVRKHCNCTRRSFLRSTVVLGNNTYNVRFCGVRNATEARCLRDITAAIENNSILCNCLPACRQKIYKTSLSSSKINEEFYRTVKGVKTLVAVGNGTEHSQGIYGKDMVGLKVYYKTLQVECFTEVPSYSWETLVANIGGNLGFFMGLSLVTFLEVIEFFWDAVISFINWKCIGCRTRANSERSRERDACNVNPMCRWSWFTESCFCVQSPCLTEFCITRNDKECFCASIMCASDDPAMTSACQNFTTSKGMIRCVCDMKFKYPKATTTTNRTQVEEVPPV